MSQLSRRTLLAGAGCGAAVLGRSDYTVFEPARDQGFGPDTISSDLHAVSGSTPGMPFLPWVMSKFLRHERGRIGRGSCRVRLHHSAIRDGSVETAPNWRRPRAVAAVADQPWVRASASSTGG